VVVKTHKAIPLQEIEMTSRPLDKNNEMKFAFLSHETIPDYRSVDVSRSFLSSHLYVMPSALNRKCQMNKRNCVEISTVYILPIDDLFQIDLFDVASIHSLVVSKRTKAL